MRLFVHFITFLHSLMLSEAACVDLMIRNFVLYAVRRKVNEAEIKFEQRTFTMTKKEKCFVFGTYTMLVFVLHFDARSNCFKQRI